MRTCRRSMRIYRRPVPRRGWRSRPAERSLCGSKSGKLFLAPFQRSAARQHRLYSRASRQGKPAALAARWTALWRGRPSLKSGARRSLCGSGAKRHLGGGRSSIAGEDLPFGRTVRAAPRRGGRRWPRWLLGAGR